MSGPYGAAAVDYWNVGWRGVLPVPFRAKKWPPKGYTGADGAYPSYADVYDMANNGHAGHRGRSTALHGTNRSR